MHQIQTPTYNHIDQILALNSKYLINHLSDTEKQNGFIRIEYDREDLEKIIDHKEIVIAVDNDKVVGYFLVGKKSEKLELELQKVMSLVLHDSGKFEYKRIGFGCQICIEEKYRGNGISKNMVDALKDLVMEKYDYLLSTISSDNKVSLQNSTMVGWYPIDLIEFPRYYLLKVK